MKGKYLLVTLMLSCFAIGEVFAGMSINIENADSKKESKSTKDDVKVENALFISPKPIDENATIRFSLRSKGYTIVDIYNAEGQYLRTIQEGILHDGRTTVFISKNHYPDGKYLLKVSSGKAIATREITIK